MAEIDELLAAWAEVNGGDDAAWRAARPGPHLAAVSARIGSVPRAFLDERVSLAALAGDVLPASPACLRFADVAAVRLGAAIALWLLASEELVDRFEPPLAGTAADGGTRAVDALALRVAPVADPLEWLSDDERREEAARTFLLWCGYLPAGEDVATARSLAEVRDSLQRNRALADAYTEQQHRAEIARRLSDARAKEAAARYSRE